MPEARILRLESLLIEAISRWPERVFLEFLGREFSYAEVGHMAGEIAKALKYHGFKPGERVALCLPNCPYYIGFFYGVLLAGGVVVNLNPLYSLDEMAKLLADSDSVLAVTADVPMLVDKFKQLKIKTIICPLGEMMPLLQGWGYRLFKAAKPPKNLALYGALLDKAAAPLLPGRRHTPRIDADVALLQYTGGTTGTPKAAMLTHANLLANAAQSAERLGNGAGEVEHILGVLPLFHVFALTSSLLMGTKLGARLTLVPRFTPASLLDCIRASKPTLLPGVPALFDALALVPGVSPGDFTSVRHGVSGGAPLPPQVKQRFEAASGVSLREGYGLTEASPVVACTLTTGRREGSVGLPLRDTVIEIRDPQGKKLKVGEKGEIWVKGPQVMKGYWKNPQDTRLVLSKGWLRTGDAGHLDADGWLYVTDRLKDMIIVNGYKVYPRMVEEALLQHPAVAEVTVAGIAHPHKGEVPKAFIRVKTGAKLTASEILAFAAARLSPMERPAEVEFRDSLPKTLIGKPSRRALQK